MAITITEALAEIKTIGKRVEKKREFIKAFVARLQCVSDPHEKDGGSPQAIAREFQAVRDLEDRLVALRRGIQRANDETIITVGGKSMSIADWLVWRRDAAPMHRDFLTQLAQAVNAYRERAKRDGVAIVASATATENRSDIVVNINEQALAAEIEGMETILGQLDGQLSLKNATVQIAA